MEAKGGGSSPRTRDVRAFLREAEDGARFAAERMEEFAKRLRLLTERSSALSKLAPPLIENVDLLAEVREREAELAKVYAELRRRSDQLAEAREFVERERSRYTDLFESTAEATVETDARGVMREANRAAATLLAHPQEQLVGKLLIAFVARGDTRAFRRHLSSLTAVEAVPAFEVRMRPRGGVPFLASVSVRAVPGPGAFRWALRCVPASSPAEIRLVDILALAVQELRAPLTATLGWLQLLRERVAPDWDRDGVLLAIYESAQAQSQLLEDLSEIVHVRRTGSNNRRAQMPLAEIVARAAESVRPEAERRGVDLFVEQSGAEPLLDCDEVRARRAIARLLLRAVWTVADGEHVRARVTRKGDEAILELFAPGMRTLAESPLALAALIESFATDGARLVVPPHVRDGLLCSARWAMGVPSWRRGPGLTASPAPPSGLSDLIE